jgi:hypothetical protein
MLVTNSTSNELGFFLNTSNFTPAASKRVAMVQRDSVFFGRMRHRASLVGAQFQKALSDQVRIPLAHPLCMSHNAASWLVFSRCEFAYTVTS